MWKFSVLYPFGWNKTKKRNGPVAFVNIPTFFKQWQCIEFQVVFFWKYFCNSVILIHLVECASSSDSRSPLVNKHYLIECASHDSWNALLHIYYLVECAFVECALFLERFMRTQRGLAVPANMHSLKNVGYFTNNIQIIQTRITFPAWARTVHSFWISRKVAWKNTASLR